MESPLMSPWLAPHRIVFGFALVLTTIVTAVNVIAFPVVTIAYRVESTMS